MVGYIGKYAQHFCILWRMCWENFIFIVIAIIWTLEGRSHWHCHAVTLSTTHTRRVHARGRFPKMRTVGSVFGCKNDRVKWTHHVYALSCSISSARQRSQGSVLPSAAGGSTLTLAFLLCSCAYTLVPIEKIVNG